MTTTPDLTDIRWLVGDEAAAVLADLAASPAPLHTVAAQLRRTHSAERTGLLLEQLELRERGTAKFSRAERMYFTRVGLQQATDEWVAGYKASRFAGLPAVADVCCGVGGDLVALSAVSNATGIDSCPIVSVLAAANLRAYEGAGDCIRTESASAASVRELDAWHADPDRRAAGWRTTQLAFHSPDAATLDAMLHAQPNAAVKLAPAAEAPDAWAESCEQQWLSRRGECRQLCVWFGALSQSPGLRRATRLGDDGQICGDFIGRVGAPERVAQSLGGFLYEPNPSVLAAKLTDDLADTLGLLRVSRGVGYLAGEEPVEHPLVSGFRIDDTLPLKPKTIAGYLRERGVGRLEIKHRGVPLEPDRLRKQLKLSGTAEATLIAFPHAGRNVAAVATRL
ncbi:hypothetical protein KOR34_06590 [Posidoniimonas corsicana]|uniref:THUMP-like domain-containing protein n=1 Tax=Posidoniimonas corsicana TaxID=1938618 RepID=A0A5C5VDN3_9BACT|nr:hypothetical protein [Posidoniimonas corsicana]TWT35765.1 hypothetical protein KOR34_06590 [Posidoniimonas corsicana]